MTGPKIRAELAARSAYFAGDMSVIHSAIRLARCAKQYDPRRRAMAVPRGAADDVMAAIEFQFGGEIELVDRINTRTQAATR